MSNPQRTLRRGQEPSAIRKGVYVFAGLLVLPCCLAAAYSTVRQIAHSGDFQETTVFFLIGFASYLTFFLAFHKPVRTYIIGHELTHALWVLLFRGKVREVHLSKNQGRVKATKTNALIALAPYFFPVCCAHVDHSNE